MADNYLFLLLFLRGTFEPFLRASDRPMAMACLRLFTFPPFPRFPERNVPRLRRRMALATDLRAREPYRGICNHPPGEVLRRSRLDTIRNKLSQERMTIAS